MIVLGLLFVLVAVGAAAFVALAPNTTAQVIELTDFGVTLKTSPLAMFLAGAVSLALLGLGYALISRGSRRKAKSRKELRQLRNEQAVSGASASADAGHRSTRRDRRQKDGSTDVSADTSTKTSSDNGPDSKVLPPERQPDSEQPSSP